MVERSELAAFLRARRERLSPAEVGLPVGRRRTPGLRREEVATLAGVSIDYLVRLEQGRDTNPSPAVLAALGDALRLTPDERHHLGRLVAKANHGEFCPSAPPLRAEVRTTVKALLDRLSPTPAFVLGPSTDVLASNDAWAMLVAPLGLLDRVATGAGATPNIARYVFLDERAPRVFADWERTADDQAAQLHAAQSCRSDDEQFRSLVAELMAVPAFAARWDAHSIDVKRSGRKRIVHPEVGELLLDYEVLTLADQDQRVVTWLPANDATARLLDALLDVPAPVSPARLRVVNPA
jgi:transcriptional regulator with XRE-family HTH domain